MIRKKNEIKQPVTKMELSKYFQQDPSKVIGMRGTFGPRPNNTLRSSDFGSMLQKTIRRGLVKEASVCYFLHISPSNSKTNYIMFCSQALYAAFVLYQFGCYEKGAALVTFLVNRLTIISFEDIGLADPWLADNVITALKTVRAEPHGSVVACCTLAAVVRRLCTAPKTRIGSWLRNALGRADNTEFCPKDKTMEAWLGPYVSLADDVFVPGYDVAHVMSVLEAKGLLTPSPLQAWASDTSNKKRREWIMSAIQLYMRTGTARTEKDLQPIAAISRVELDTILEHARTSPTVLEGELKNAVFDLHTGKRNRNDLTARAHFATIGARIENELVLHECHRDLYEAYVVSKQTGNEGTFPVCAPTKSVEPTAPLTSTLFELTEETEHLSFKQPTWIVKALSGIESVSGNAFVAGQTLFVKIADPGAQFAAHCAHLRASIRKMVAPTTCVIQARVDTDYRSVVRQRGEKTPGVWAAKVNKRMDDVLKGDPSRVVDILCMVAMPASIPLCKINIACATNRTLRGILKVLIFRKAVMTTDTNAFNLLLLEDDRIMSVDENPPNDKKRAELLTKGVSLITAQPIRANIRAAVRTWAETNRETMSGFTDRVSSVCKTDMQDVLMEIKEIFVSGDISRLI